MSLRIFIFLCLSSQIISTNSQKTINVFDDEEPPKQTEILIDSNSTPVENFSHFWTSTGLSPPDPKETIYKYFTTDDLRFNMALMGALPNQGMKQVRIHWLFYLIFVDPVDNSLDFTYLDDLMDFLTAHNLKPRFELMGTPVPKNATLPADLPPVQFWQDLTEKIAFRYIDKFGAEEVSSWTFELWNEPDLKNYDLLNWTLSYYLDYVNASATALKNAFKNTGFEPTLGGPAGLFQDKSTHPLCWGLAEACNDLTFDCPLKYLSFHRKGDATAVGLVNETLLALDSILNEFPNLRSRNLPISNDEADLITTWSRPYEFRTDVRYAAMAVKSIQDHFKFITLDRKLDIELINFDNGFLNYNPFFFEQRTLFARFQMNLTDPPHNQFIKKPIYSLYSLLSLLGDKYLESEIIFDDSLLTVIPTSQIFNNQSIISIIIAYSDSDVIDSQIRKSVGLKIKDLVPDSRYVVYLLDNIVSNPYAVWQDFLSPVFPDKNVRRRLRQVEEPLRIIAPSDYLDDGNRTLEINFKLTLPSVALIQICTKSLGGPDFIIGPVGGLSVFNVTGGEILLTWSDKNINSKCIKTFEVEHQTAEDSSFRRINVDDTIFLSFHFAPDDERTVGRYRVRAVDFWAGVGEYSNVIDFA